MQYRPASREGGSLHDSWVSLRGCSGFVLRISASSSGEPRLAASTGPLGKVAGQAPPSRAGTCMSLGDRSLLSVHDSVVKQGNPIRACAAAQRAAPSTAQTLARLPDTRPAKTAGACTAASSPGGLPRADRSQRWRRLSGGGAASAAAAGDGAHRRGALCRGLALHAGAARHAV